MRQISKSESGGLVTHVQCLLAVAQTVYLPPANEFWGQVMLLHVSIILYTGGGQGVGSWLPSMHYRSHDWSPGGLPLGESASRGFYIQGGLSPGGGGVV